MKFLPLPKLVWYYDVSKLQLKLLFLGNAMYEFIDFFAEWCGPCHAMKPIIEDLEKSYAGKIKFSKYDVDKNQELAGTHGVMSIPTYLVKKDGKEVDRKIGALTRDKMKAWLDSFAA